MAQRTFVLTGTATDGSGALLGNKPCSFQHILAGVAGALIDGNGDFVSIAPIPFLTNADGTFPALTVDFPGDFQTVYQNAQVRVRLNGVVIDSPVGFGYASSIDIVDWINATTATGLVTMRAVYTRDDGTPIPGATGNVSLSDSAIVTVSGQFRSSNTPVPSVAATDGTMRFSVDPSSALTPGDLGYILQISGEPRPWQFTVPAVVDVYRGAWSNTTTYSGASGASNGDVVLDSGVLYRYSNTTPSSGHATSDATRWTALPASGPGSLPTDLIAAHLTIIGPSNGTIIGPSGVSASPNFTPLAGDPLLSPGSLDDQLVDMTAETRARLRYLGAWSSATAYVANDVVLSGGIDYISILAGTNHTPAPSPTYWTALGGSGGISGSNAATLLGALDPSAVDGDLVFRKKTIITSTVLGAIGDSISHDVPPSGSVTPPAGAAANLSLGIVTVTANDQAIGGSSSADWVPGSTNLSTAKVAFATAGVRLVSVMLGTNDAKAGVATTPTQYRANLESMIGDLVGSGYLVIVHAPPYVVPGSGGGLWDSASSTRLVAYQQEIASLVDGLHVFQGDVQSYAYFAANPAELYDGIHPTAQGGIDLAALWSATMQPLINGLTGTTILQRLVLGANLSIVGNILQATGGRTEILVASNTAGPPVQLTNTAQDDFVFSS